MPRRIKRDAPETQPTPNGVEPPTPPDEAEQLPLDHAEPVESPTVAALPPPRPEKANGLAALHPPEVVPDKGLYAVLGLEPSVSDVVIQTTYRRMAARVLGGGSTDKASLRQLNVAYEVLGNPVRRAEYDYALRTARSAPAPPTPIQSSTKGAHLVTRRTRPRQAVMPRYAGIGDVLVVLMVVGLAVVAGALIIPRVSLNLSALNALSNVLPNGSSRRVIDATVTPAAATPAVTATVPAGLAERFTGSSVAVSEPGPASNTQENVLVKLRRDGQPGSNIDVWATAQYRTTSERWPPSGSVKTDASGNATISFNVGAPTPGFPVQVRVYAQVGDQQLSWSTSFTPR